ncbi:MAG: hypothetical protein ACYCWE_00050 [Eubacteriales bacterium]
MNTYLRTALCIIEILVLDINAQKNEHISVLITERIIMITSERNINEA